MTTRTCPVCRLPAMSVKSYLCRTCQFDPAAEPNPADALTGGRWLVAGGIRRWVRDGEGYDDLARTDRARARQRARVRDLDEERLEGGWFTRHGDLFDDSPGRQAARLAELVREANLAYTHDQEQETAA